MIYNLIQFLIDRIHRGKDKEKYMEFVKELYKYEILDEKGFNILNENNNAIQHIPIEKDDYNF